MGSEWWHSLYCSLYLTSTFIQCSSTLVVVNGDFNAEAANFIMICDYQYPYLGFQLGLYIFLITMQAIKTKQTTSNWLHLNIPEISVTLNNSFVSSKMKTSYFLRGNSVGHIFCVKWMYKS